MPAISMRGSIIPELSSCFDTRTCIAGRCALCTLQIDIGLKACEIQHSKSDPVCRCPSYNRRGKGDNHPNALDSQGRQTSSGFGDVDVDLRPESKHICKFILRLQF